MSSVIVVIRLPISCVRSVAISCHVPAVSMANGCKWITLLSSFTGENLVISKSQNWFTRIRRRQRHEGRLIALSKKDGGIRPITVGYTLRRLAAKCAIQRGNACWPISSICLSCSVLSCGLLLCKEEMRFLSQHHGHRVN